MKFNKVLKLSNSVTKTLKLFRFEATSFPGKVVRKFCPDFLSQCNKHIAHPRFAITGTNGKTTTSGVLCEILNVGGLNIINNKLGANMPNGIITALSNGLYKKRKADGVVLECDEAYFQKVSNEFIFDYILITNLFRDQLDRYGEMDIAREKIIKGIELNPDLKVVLNADDPSLVEVVEKLKYNKNNFIYYGIKSVEYIGYEENSKSPVENIYCPICHEPVQYKKRYYAQLGEWYCGCKNKKNIDVLSDVIIYPDKSILKINYKDKTFEAETALTGLYNAYNVLGAITCALIENISIEKIKDALLTYSPVFGRHQKIKLKNGGTLTIHLIKNPVGASEVLRGLKNLENSKMLLSVNDNYADGRDVSWLWDADFESLKDFNNVIYTTGTRSYDIALRMKYAGLNTKLLEVYDNTEKVSRDLEYTIEDLKENENLVVLVTYTGLLDINKNLNKIIKKYGIK